MLAGIAAAALASSPAASDTILSAGAGGLVPWEGDGGYSIVGSVGFNPFSQVTRLAVEFEYRDQDAKIDLTASGFGVIKMPVDTYDLRAVFRLVFNPGGLAPYLGIGAGLKLIVVDDSDLKKVFDIPDLPSEFTSTKSYGVSGGLIGLVGVELPLVKDRFAIFLEARADYSWEFTDGVSALLDNDHLGAFTGMGGLRFMF